MAFTPPPALLSARLLAGAIVLSALTLAACSGANATGLFDAPSGGGGILDASTGSSSTSDSAAPSNNNGGSVADSGDHDSSPAKNEDSSAPLSDDSGPPIADSAPPADPGISCGTDTCDPKTKVCCIGQDNNNDQTFTCESASDCTNSGGLSLPCQRAADCRIEGFPAGTVCCVSEGMGSQSASSVSCVAASACDQPSQSWLCDPAVADSCPAGDTCTQSMVTIPPYSICVKSP